MSELNADRVREILAEKKQEIEAQQAVLELLQGLVDEAERNLSRLVCDQREMHEHPDVLKALNNE